MQTAGISKVLQLFNLLSKAEQLEITEKINKQTFQQRWEVVDNALPDTELSEEDIMTEVRAVRYAKKD